MAFYTGKFGKAAAPDGTPSLTLKTLKSAESKGYGFTLYTKTFPKGTLLNAETIRKSLNSALVTMWKLDHGNLERSTITREYVASGALDWRITITAGPGTSHEEVDEDSIRVDSPVSKFQILIDDSYIHMTVL